MNQDRDDLLAKVRIEHERGERLQPGEIIVLRHANATCLKTLRVIIETKNPDPTFRG